MIQPPTTDATYRRFSDDQIITVLGCTGTEPMDSVSYRLGATGGGKRFYVQLGNFWKKYTEWPNAEAVTR